MKTLRPNNSSRRAFVKNASLLAGSAVVLPSMAQAHFFSQSGDVIKIALIGCGGRGTGAAIQALRTNHNVKLVAMADAFKDKIDHCYETITSEEIDDHAKLLARIDVPEERKFVGFDAYKQAIALADVVLLTTPPGFRPIHFEEAVKKGKHVFMEKPLATDIVGINKIIEAAKIAKLKKLNVVVGLQRHYQNSYKAIFQRKDLIGDIVSAQAWWHTEGIWVHERTPAETEMEYQMRNWYYFNWLCGDHIVEQHIHNIDVVNWFKGAYPVKAQGMGGRQVRIGKEYGQIFDHHYIEFQYADGTILNSQCRHIPGTMSKVDELIVGTKGKIYCDGAIIKDNTGAVKYQFDKKGENNPYQTEHDELFAAVAKGNYTCKDADHGIQSTLTAILGRMASYSGQAIDINKALASNLNLMPKEYSFNAPAPVMADATGFYPIAKPGVTKYV